LQLRNYGDVKFRVILKHAFSFRPHIIQSPTSIGVNNRDVHLFKVELGTMSGLVGMVDPEEVTLCELSGIAAREDMERYEKEGVGAILVGETLIRAGKEVDN